MAVLIAKTCSFVFPHRNDCVAMGTICKEFVGWEVLFQTENAFSGLVAIYC